MQLQHSTGGDTNTVGFMKDDLTSSPSVDVSSATVTQNNAGTFRYISGIPYYNSGSPTLTVAGVEIDHLVGQCYTDQNDIVEVDDGANQEGTSSNAITNSGYTYAQIDGASTMLEGGIPKVNTGTASSYAIGSLTVPITSSSVRTISRVKVRAKNVNGTSSYSSSIATNIQVHTASQSGINETAIAVSDSLGNGDLTNDGVQGPDFTGNVSEWYETLVETINDVSAQIHRKTLRGGANFIVVSPEVANLLEFTAGFRGSVTHDDDRGQVGAVRVGSLSKKFDVYVDPYFPRNVVLCGRKGSSFLESGYVYAPYVPLQMTPTIFGTEDFVPRKGVMTRYAKKMVRPDMYGLVIVTDLV